MLFKTRLSPLWNVSVFSIMNLQNHGRFGYLTLCLVVSSFGELPENFNPDDTEKQQQFCYHQIRTQDEMKNIRLYLLLQKGSVFP